MRVLSLFDGLSGGQVALRNLGIHVDRYYASEVDKYAISITQKNFPNTIQLGDITNIGVAKPFYDKWIYDKPTGEKLHNIGDGIDLLMGGSPCQGFSSAGNGKGFDGKSKLFWEYVRVLNETKPKYFLLENVVMKQEWKDIITLAMGVEPIEINSNLVSAQNRKRLFWTNIPYRGLPVDKNILLKDVLEDDADPKHAISDSKIDRVLNTPRGKGFFYNKTHKKIGTIIAGYHKLPTDGTYIDLGFPRKLTPLECERLQTLPEGYTEGVSDTQRYAMIGNGWTIDVIAHILKKIRVGVD